MNSTNSSKTDSIFGTVDVVLLNEKKKHIDLLDYKFGRARVDHASENAQGHAYMVGGFDRYPWADTCTVHFIAPRLDEVTKHTYERKDLAWHRLRIAVIVGRATADEPDLTPRTEACKFCAQRLKCKALHDALLPIAKKHDGNNFAIDVLKKFSPEQVDDPQILGRMMQVAPVMESWASAVKKRSLQVATETGEQIPGFEVRYRNPPAKIHDTQLAFDALGSELNPEEFMDACKVSVVDLAKALSKKLPRGQKGGARSKVELALMKEGLLPEEEDVQKTPFLAKTS
jgi:hypothetical protein